MWPVSLILSFRLNDRLRGQTRSPVERSQCFLAMWYFDRVRAFKPGSELSHSLNTFLTIGWQDRHNRWPLFKWYGSRDTTNTLEILIVEFINRFREKACLCWIYYLHLETGTWRYSLQICAQQNWLFYWHRSRQATFAYNKQKLPHWCENVNPDGHSEKNFFFSSTATLTTFIINPLLPLMTLM